MMVAFLIVVIVIAGVMFFWWSSNGPLNSFLKFMWLALAIWAVLILNSYVNLLHMPVT